MKTLLSRRPSPAMVVALIALVVATAGTAYAAQTINAQSMRKLAPDGLHEVKNSYGTVAMEMMRAENPVVKVRFDL